MTSNRPYRDAMPSRVARLRLAQAVESQFDTSVVAAFEAILAGADEDYRLAQRGDFREFAQSTYDASDVCAGLSRRSRLIGTLKRRLNRQRSARVHAELVVDLMCVRLDR